METETRLSDAMQALLVANEHITELEQQVAAAQARIAELETQSREAGDYLNQNDRLSEQLEEAQACLASFASRRLQGIRASLEQQIKAAVSCGIYTSKIN
jgi:septal ring factor EnvC (AmiA/AmiB activator)